MRKYGHFTVLGLQRSGTNWIEGLIKENFEVSSVRKWPDWAHWKHLTPLGVNPDFYDPDGKPTPDRKIAVDHPQMFDLRHLDLWHEGVLHIGVQKKFSVWCDSINRNPVDFRQSHNHPDPEAASKLLPEALYVVYKEWDTWKSNHVNRKHNFIFKTYDQWLDNWPEILSEIHEKTGWERSNKTWVNVNPKSVFLSGNFDIKMYRQ